MSDDSNLDPVEARVLGCLLEKERTTPEYYPLTLNSLMAACNQRSNRDPVTEWDETIIEAGVDRLRRKRLAVMIHMAGSRVPKYKHSLDSVYGNLDEGMVAVLCELLVRNLQSPAELRSRVERLDVVCDASGLETYVQRLADYGSGALVEVLPPGGGRRVPQVPHLLGGPVTPGVSGSLSGQSPSAFAGAAGAAGGVVVPPPPDWKTGIEAELAALREQVASLQEQVDRLRAALE